MIEPYLLCCICGELMHKSIAMLPCMHSTCAYCFDMWVRQETKYGNDATCPVCRATIKDIQNNFPINGMIESFLKVHPERERDKDELLALDSECKITDELLREKHVLSKLSTIYGFSGASIFCDFLCCCINRRCDTDPFWKRM